VLQFLPPLPDQATLDAMGWWACGGAAIGFGAIVVQWLKKPRVKQAPLAIPGAPKPDDPAPTPWGPSGLFAAVGGAVLAALWAWGWYGPEEAMSRIGVILAVLGVLQSVRLLLHTLGDVPAVGEPPPEDPDKNAAARLPGAWFGLVMAGLGVLMALAP
jgi:hypothetical protein